MTKAQRILETLTEPRTLAEIQSKVGEGANRPLARLERKGAIRRYIHDRQDQRGKQQRRYITMYVATGRGYVTRNMKNENL